jgi:hypothetical protein
VKSGGRVFFVRTDDIDWIEASGNYVRLHLKEQSYLFRETMNQMESRLDTQRFFRIHRSRIVNTERIKELRPGSTANTSSCCTPDAACALSAAAIGKTRGKTRQSALKCVASEEC